MKTVLRLLTAIVVAIMLSCAAPAYTSKAESNSSKYTSVMDDLEKDGSFSTYYYPEDTEDNSLRVIQVSESSDKELFIYVYQASGQTKNLRATSINISRTSEVDINPSNYELEFLNSEGTLFKYLVKDFTVSVEPVRYYGIVSIYRAFDESLGDEKAEHNNTISETPFEVAKQWTFGQINGKLYCSVVDIETITVTDKFVGFVRYESGFTLWPWEKACDAHFVAFNTDKSIDKLISASVSFSSQKINNGYVIGKEDSPLNLEFGQIEPSKEVSVYYKQKVSYAGNGLFAHTYEWERIQLVEEFIKNENREFIYHGGILDVEIPSKIKDEDLIKLKTKKWILRFVETEFNYIDTNGVGVGIPSRSCESTFVSDVTILRLKFETDGITYNLGVVDNKQTGEVDSNGIPVPIVPEESVSIGLNPNIGLAFGQATKFLAIVLLVFIVILLLPFIPTIIRVIIFVVATPTKLIIKAVKKISKNKKEK